MRRVTAWLRSELAAAASRAERYGMARLVRVDFRRIGRAGRSAVAGRLRRWRGRGFTQAEQLAAYRARLPAGRSSAEAKRAALMRQQLEAVDWLEVMYAQPVPVVDGCRPLLADTVETAGATCGQLVGRIQQPGRRLDPRPRRHRRWQGARDRGLPCRPTRRRWRGVSASTSRCRASASATPTSWYGAARHRPGATGQAGGPPRNSTACWRLGGAPECSAKKPSPEWACMQTAFCLR
ncbi:hypothetical protein ACU4GD_34240 [Cupriavidus basilensis]